MDISIVTPTKNRPEDFEHLLNSLMKQTVTPSEIIIVDDSDDEKTLELVKKFQKLYGKIKFKYLRGNGEGTTQARNAGLLGSSSEICCFIDDDVILDKHYLEEILKFFINTPRALGVQGYVPINVKNFQSFRSKLRNALHKIFLLPHIEKGRMRVLASGHVTFPYDLDREILCSWLSCTNSCYKRKILECFKFDESLKGYALWDDVDLSFRVYKKYPKSLYVIPSAKILHKISPFSRPSREFYFYAFIEYDLYFLMKNMRSVKNFVAFIWSLFGLMLTCLFNANDLICLVKVCIDMFRNTKNIINGRFSFIH